MSQAVIQLVPLGLGIALSPSSLVKFVLVLLSRRAWVNGLVFVAGLVVLLTAVPVVAALTFEGVTDDTTSAPGTAKAWIFVVLGVALLGLATRAVRREPDGSTPAVFEKMADLGPGAVLLLGPGVTTVNPKNLLLLLSAGSVAGSHDLTGLPLLGAVGVFAVVAASPFIAGLVYLGVRGDEATRRLGVLNDWLIRNNRTIVVVVLAVLGTYLVVQGLSDLLA